MTSLRGPEAGSGPGAGRPLMMRQRRNQDNNQDHWAVAGVWRPTTSHACFTVYWFHLACEEWRGQPLEIPWSPPRESSSIWANLQIICMCLHECACPWHVNFCKKKGVPPSHAHSQDSAFALAVSAIQNWKLDLKILSVAGCASFIFYLLWQIKVAILRISFRVCLLALPLKIPVSAHVAMASIHSSPSVLSFFSRAVEVLLLFAVCGLLSRCVNMLPNFICCANLWFLKRFISLAADKSSFRFHFKST